MIKLTVKNIKEIEESFHEAITTICDEKKEYYETLFKNYSKDLNLEVIFTKDGKNYKTSASLNMKTKKLLLVETGKDPLKVLTRLCSEFKKTAKRQYDLERKDYEYKRKR